MRVAVNNGSKSHKRKNIFRPRLLLFRFFAWLIVFAVGWCGYMLWLINSYNHSKQLPKADAAIVLGAALWNDKPSPALKERLDYALMLYKQGNFERFILSGGLDHNGSTLTEAQGMRAYLMSKGVPKDKLIVENHAKSTYENLLYSHTIVRKLNVESILIVTHDFHAARAEEIARFLKYEKVETAAFSTKVMPQVTNESREVLAFTKWRLDSFLLKFGVRSPDAL